MGNFASAQFVRNPSTGTATGMSFSGSTTSDANGNWGKFTPSYSNAGCSTGLATNVSAASGTGQVDYTITNMVNGYDNFGGATCYAGVRPSFSFSANTSAALDLSGAGNKTLSISIKSSIAFTVDVILQSASYSSILDSANALSILGDGAYHTYTVNFSSSRAAGLNGVYAVAFAYNSAAHTNTAVSGTLSVNSMKIGSSNVVTGIFSPSLINSNMTITPNPASSEVVVSYSGTSGNLTFNVTDVAGKVVKTVAGNGTSANINVSDLSKGMYFVTTISDNTPVSVSKLVVE